MAAAALHGGDGGEVVTGEPLCACHGELARGERAGLVEGHGVGLGEQVDAAAALEEDAAARGGADAGEVAQWYADDQGAGAGDDEEHQGAAKPCRKRVVYCRDGQREQPRQHDDGHGDGHHRRRVDAGEAPHEEFGGRFACRCVLHHGEDASHGRLAGAPCDAQAYRGSGGDHAGEHLAASVYGARLGFAREGGGVEGGGSGEQRAVEGDALARTHLYGLSYGDVLGADLSCRAVGADEACAVGTQGHEAAYVVAGAVDGAVLQGLADLVEQHHGYRLGIFADGEGAGGCDRHEHVLAEGIAPGGVLRGLSDDAQAYGQKGCDVPEQCSPAVPQGGNGGGKAGVCGDDAGGEHHGGEGKLPEVQSFALFAVGVAMAVVMGVCVCVCHMMECFVVYGCKGRENIVQPGCNVADGDKTRRKTVRISQRVEPSGQAP